MLKTSLGVCVSHSPVNTVDTRLSETGVRPCTCSPRFTCHVHVRDGVHIVLSRACRICKDPFRRRRGRGTMNRPRVAVGAERIERWQTGRINLRVRKGTGRSSCIIILVRR